VIDGADLMPVFKREGHIADRVIHWKHGDAWAVRQGPWKLIGQGTKANALVHVIDDPGEKTNRMQEKADLVSHLQTLHQRWLAEVAAR